MKPTFHLMASVSLSLTLGLGAIPAAFSETVAIPLGQQGDHWEVSRPQTGISKAQVSDLYGDPLERSGPVGNPRIYTWVYPTFKVYFEDDRVIHSVVIAH